MATVQLSHPFVWLHMDCYPTPFNPVTQRTVRVSVKLGSSVTEPKQHRKGDVAQERCNMRTSCSF